MQNSVQENGKRSGARLFLLGGGGGKNTYNRLLSYAVIVNISTGSWGKRSPLETGQRRRKSWSKDSFARGGAKRKMDGEKNGKRLTRLAATQIKIRRKRIYFGKFFAIREFRVIKSRRSVYSADVSTQPLKKFLLSGEKSGERLW